MKLSLVTFRQDDQETDYTGRIRIMRRFALDSRELPNQSQLVGQFHQRSGKLSPISAGKGRKIATVSRIFSMMFGE